MDAELLTVAEAAKVLAIGRSTLYSKLISTGLVPVVRIGTSVRIPRVALAAYVRRITDGPDNENGHLR